MCNAWETEELNKVTPISFGHSIVLALLQNTLSLTTSMFILELSESNRGHPNVLSGYLMDLLEWHFRARISH